MASIAYVYGGNLYLNLTNRCPCDCTFCIRTQSGLGTGDDLWLNQDPTAAQVIAEFDRYPLSDYPEVTFCGYGEPLCALDVLLEVCRYIRGVSDIKIRINTNGLGDLINGKPTAHLLEGLADTVSVSLNAPDAASYNAVTRPTFGLPAYAAMLQFARDCKQYVPRVIFTVVDVITPEEIQGCKNRAEDLQIPLRVRHFY